MQALQRVIRGSALLQNGLLSLLGRLLLNLSLLL
jgi:hypothetical protein